MFPKQVWLACYLIVLIYWCTFLGLEGDPFLNPTLKHVINFSLLLTVAFVGYYGWTFYKEKWLQKVWALYYILIIFLMGVLGGMDLLNRFENASFRNLLANLRLFSTSPVPYGILMLLARFSKSSVSKKPYL